MPHKNFFVFPSSKSSVVDSFGSLIPPNTAPFPTSTRPSMPPSVQTDVPVSPTLGSPGATIRPRRYTAPSDTLRQQWAGKKTTVPKHPLAAQAFPVNSTYVSPQTQDTAPPDIYLNGLGIDARRRMAEEFVKESSFIVEEGVRRRSLEDDALKEQVAKEFDEETVKLSKIQERKRLAQQRDRLGSDLRRIGGGRDFRSRSTTDLPHQVSSDNNVHNPGHQTQHSEPVPPSSSSSSSSKERPFSTPPSSSTSRLLRNLQQQWWKTEEKRRQVEKEKEHLRQEEELAREVRALEDAWAIYESRWNLLNIAARSATPSGHSHTREQSTTLQLSFTDIPWPTITPARSKNDLTAAAFGAFFLSHHLPRGKATKDRIRDALLRWHPDRFEGRYLEKIRPQDREDVMEGVGMVVRYLNTILTTR